uniref:Uncharacterized protein n=1 Tax=Rousettus aegyptiacus TaxID=9407 RepID=A0A7J8IN97_ROUAE|nr:hypothetical protein HJG63_010760 [Rousettus aegyptiacus]
MTGFKISQTQRCPFLKSWEALDSIGQAPLLRPRWGLLFSQPWAGRKQIVKPRASRAGLMRLSCCPQLASRRVFMQAMGGSCCPPEVQGSWRNSVSWLTSSKCIQVHPDNFYLNISSDGRLIPVRKL